LRESSSLDLVSATRQLFQRLRPYRAELDRLIHEGEGDPDFSEGDLEAFFNCCFGLNLLWIYSRLRAVLPRTNMHTEISTVALQ
jgi:hypothetical protein